MQIVQDTLSATFTGNCDLIRVKCQCLLHVTVWLNHNIQTRVHTKKYCFIISTIYMCVCVQCVCVYTYACLSIFIYIYTIFCNILHLNSQHVILHFLHIYIFFNYFNDFDFVQFKKYIYHNKYILLKNIKGKWYLKMNLFLCIFYFSSAFLCIDV